jgi:hypothetical protein
MFVAIALLIANIGIVTSGVTKWPKDASGKPYITPAKTLTEADTFSPSNGLTPRPGFYYGPAR